MNTASTSVLSDVMAMIKSSPSGSNAIGDVYSKGSPFSIFCISRGPPNRGGLLLLGGSIIATYL